MELYEGLMLRVKGKEKVFAEVIHYNCHLDKWLISAEDKEELYTKYEAEIYFEKMF